MVEIDGTEVDINDPCAVLAQLNKVYLKIATEGGVSVTRFGQDEVRYSAVNLDKLQAVINSYERKCAAKSGRRTRYAASIRWRG